MSEDTLLYLDKGVLVNLWATGHVIAILQAMPYRCAVIEEMYPSSLLLWATAQNDEEPVDREEVSVLSLVQSGMLELHSFQQEKYIQSYIPFAQHVPDTKAALLTLTTVQNGILASDDRRTRRIFRQFAPGATLLGTLSFLHAWQKQLTVGQADMQTIVRLIKQKAQFLPPEDDPLFPWWTELFAKG